MINDKRIAKRDKKCRKDHFLNKNEYLCTLKGGLLWSKNMLF